jgi:phosphate/sulfate permease
VVWYEPKADFPYVGGIVPIVISWFLSPLLAALITLVLFLAVRTLVLRRANSTKIAFYVLPVLILLTFFINLFFILVSARLAAVLVGDAVLVGSCVSSDAKCANDMDTTSANSSDAGLHSLDAGVAVAVLHPSDLFLAGTATVYICWCPALGLRCLLGGA